MKFKLSILLLCATASALCMDGEAKEKSRVIGYVQTWKAMNTSELADLAHAFHALTSSLALEKNLPGSQDQEEHQNLKTDYTIACEMFMDSMQRFEQLCIKYDSLYAHNALQQEDPDGQKWRDYKAFTKSREALGKKIWEKKGLRQIRK